MAAPSLSAYSNVSIPHDILTQSWDKCIKLAVAAVSESGTKSNSDPNYSACQAGLDFNIPRSSIGFHL
jgi:hypothetical protein